MGTRGYSWVLRYSPGHNDFQGALEFADHLLRTKQTNKPDGMRRHRCQAESVGQGAGLQVRVRCAQGCNLVGGVRWFGGDGSVRERVMAWHTSQTARRDHKQQGAASHEANAPRSRWRLSSLPSMTAVAATLSVACAFPSDISCRRRVSLICAKASVSTTTCSR